MGFLRANFGTRPKGGSASVQRQVALDAAKLAGSIVIFRKGKDFMVE